MLGLGPKGRFGYSSAWATRQREAAAAAGVGPAFARARAALQRGLAHLGAEEEPVTDGGVDAGLTAGLPKALAALLGPLGLQELLPRHSEKVDRRTDRFD